MKLTNSEILENSKRLYLMGFALLPILWLFNLLYFGPLLVPGRFKSEASRDVVTSAGKQMKLEYDRSLLDSRVRKYLIYSSVGMCVWIVILAVWISIFVQRRLDWGLTGDQLTVVVPKGT
ncbi:hypothetical protein MIR68_007756 [Amoeboaphelidium protococcarum]|nr:hypothetical protein MIR68_007756 [Amoeboaphelidium protococcarum]